MKPRSKAKKGEITPEQQLARDLVRMKQILRKNPDPASISAKNPDKLPVQRVIRVFPPDSLDICEVLWLDPDDRPNVAFMRGDELLYTQEGW